MSDYGPQTLPTCDLSDSPLSAESLKAYFVSGAKDPSDLQLGVEWEKIGVWRESGKAIPYWGPRGVEAIFKALIAGHHWEPVYSKGFMIGLEKNGSSITLEPGGQIELSGRKARRLSENAAELYGH